MVAGATGGGIFALRRWTAPLQSDVCEDAIACRITIQMPPLPPPPCAYQGRGKNPCETMRRAASLSAFTPFPLIKDLCHIHIIDAARRVATVFEIWCCLIETDLPARRENPPKKIAPYGTFAAVSPLEYRGLKPILPFPEGRSDAACRVVICLHAP